MIRLKKVLVPTDFSESAHHAFRYGCSFAKEYGADKDATNKKYEEKHLCLTGEVERVSFYQGEARVVFKTASKQRVAANFTAFELKETKELTAGQTITFPLQ